MPDGIGKSASTSSPGITHCTMVTGTPTPNPANFPNKKDVTSKLTSTTGLVKNMIDTKAYLEKRFLITMDNHYDIENLVHLLIM